MIHRLRMKLIQSKSNYYWKSFVVLFSLRQYISFELKVIEKDGKRLKIYSYIRMDRLPTICRRTNWKYDFESFQPFSVVFNNFNHFQYKFLISKFLILFYVILLANSSYANKIKFFLHYDFFNLSTERCFLLSYLKFSGYINQCSFFIKRKEKKYIFWFDHSPLLRFLWCAFASSNVCWFASISGMILKLNRK